MTERIPYFAYGSNISKAQMSERIPGSHDVGIGYLPNFQLVFNRHGTYRSGGVASVIPEMNAQVFGYIYMLTSQQLAVMDEIEHPDAYERKTIRVFQMDRNHAIESEIECQTYFSFPTGSYAPSVSYIQLIISSAIERGLPKKYIEMLELYG